MKQRELVFLERREKHPVRNPARALMRTLNSYALPADRTEGEPRPRGRK